MSARLAALAVLLLAAAAYAATWVVWTPVQNNSPASGASSTFGNYWGYGAVLYSTAAVNWIVPPMPERGTASFYNISSYLGTSGAVSVYATSSQTALSGYMYTGAVSAAYTAPLGSSTSISATNGVFALAAVSISSEYCGSLYFTESVGLTASSTAYVAASLSNSTWAYLSFGQFSISSGQTMTQTVTTGACFSPGTYLLAVSIYVTGGQINGVIDVQVSTSGAGGTAAVPGTQYALSISPAAGDTVVFPWTTSASPYVVLMSAASIYNTGGSPSSGYFSIAGTSPASLPSSALLFRDSSASTPYISTNNCPQNVYFLPAAATVSKLLSCSGISSPPSSAYPAYYPTDYSKYASSPAYITAWPTGPATFSFSYVDSAGAGWSATAQSVWSAAVYISSFSITSVSSPYAKYTSTSALPYAAAGGTTYSVITGAPWLYYTGPVQINGGLSGASNVTAAPYGTAPPTTPTITLNGTVREPLAQGFNPTNVPTTRGYYVRMPTCSISSNPYGGATGTYGLYNCIAITFNSLTAVVWFYLPPGGSGVILGFFGSGGWTNLVYVGYDGRLYGGDVVPGYALYTVSTSAAISPGWHMATVDEWYSGGTYYFSLYLDGSFIGQTSFKFSSPTQLFGANGPYPNSAIGMSLSFWPGLPGSNYASYTGLVAFVALYNTVLTQSQIQQIYAAGFPSALFQSNLVAAYYLSPQYYNATGGYFTPYYTNGALLAQMGISNANAYTYTPSGAQGSAASQLVSGTVFSFLGVPGRQEAFGATPNGAGVYYIQSNSTSYTVPSTAASSALYIPLTAGVYVANNIGNWWNAAHSPYTASLTAASPPPYTISVNGVQQYAYNVAWDSGNPPSTPVYMTGADGKTYAFVPSWAQQLGLSKILAAGSPALYVWGRPISQSALAFVSGGVWLNYTQTSGPYAYFPYFGSPGSMTVYANSTSTAVGSWALQIVTEGLSPTSASSANVTAWMYNGALSGSFVFPRPFSYLAFPAGGSLGPLWLLLNSTIGVPPYIVQAFPSVTQLVVSRGGYTAVNTDVSVPSQLFNQWSGNLVFAAAQMSPSGSYALMSGGFYSSPPTSFTTMLPAKSIGQLAYFLMASWPSGGTCALLQQVSSPLDLTICQGSASQSIAVNLGTATVSSPASFAGLAGAWAGLAGRIAPTSAILANAGVAALVVLMVRRGRSLTAGLMTAGALVTALGLSLWLPWMIGEGAVMFVVASAVAFTRR